MSERKMAAIRRVDELVAIPDADKIECAMIGGWGTVVKKGEFRVGDLAVFIEIDAFVPNTVAPFLTRPDHAPKMYEGILGERLRTVKLRKCLSQGLLLPLTVLPEGMVANEDDDVAEALGIVKYDPPVPAQLRGISRGNFPSIIPKTDEERIQNLGKYWTRLSDIMYEVTEKLEGSSMTVARLNGEFIVCSRNINLKEVEGNAFWDQARRYQLEEKMIAASLDDVAIQFEIVGPGILGNYYDLPEVDIYAYTGYDVQRGRYMASGDRVEIAKMLGVKHVPIVNTNFIPHGMTIQEVLQMADGVSDINPKKLREGLVFKQVSGGEHWKAVSNKYLLEHDHTRGVTNGEWDY
jgi:RNA ligase (TIGR02306 family)